MTAYSDFKGFMESVETNSILIKQSEEDPRTAKVTESFTKLRPYAFTSGKDSNLILNPATTEADLDEASIGRYARVGVGKDRERAANTCFNNLDSIVDTELPTGVLEKLVLREPIAKAIGTDADSQAIYTSYFKVQQYTQFADKLSKKEALSPEQQKVVQGHGLEGFREALAEKAKADGFSYNIQEAVRELAQFSYSKGHIAEDQITNYAIKGVTVERDKAKKAYDQLAADKKKDIYAVVRESVKKLAKGSTDEFNTAMSEIYTAGK